MRPAALQPVIVGAGVAGLTAALAFAAEGFRVRIVERAAHLNEVGAGIQLSPNATRLLDRLGVMPALSAVAVRPEALALHAARSLQTLATIPLGKRAERRWSAPYLTVHRADLQTALLETVRREPRIELAMGMTVSGVELQPGDIGLRVEAGPGHDDIRSSLVIGADGVWSALRRAMGENHQSRYSGFLAWRAMLKPGGTAASLLRTDRVTAFLDGRFHLVAYPVRNGEAINLVAVTRSGAAPRQWDNAADRALLLRAMAGAARPLREVVAEAGVWTTWPIYEVEAADWVHPAGLVLIGDAAHAMSPYAAQGAAMAIEDAAVLATAVSRGRDDLPKALAAYETMRRARVARVAARGRLNRFAWHASGPVAFGRNVVLTLRGPERLASDLDWLYGWAPEMSLEGL